MQFEVDMVVVIIELFLADLAEIGVGGCLEKVLMGLEWTIRGGILDTALNFFFELAFLEDRIFLKVFLR